MNPALLISPEELRADLAADPPLVVDCRFNLVNPQEGRELWRAGHIPGAVYADLDRDLASPVTPDSGRHPLPERESFAGWLASAGWRPGRSMVAYDAQGGAFAARLWWLMKYFGQPVVRLLDGGLPAWVATDGELVSGEASVSPTPVNEVLAALGPQPQLVLDVEALQGALGDGAITLLDARDPARFAGAVEPIDPVAGHVPGAHNRPFNFSLDDRGRFLDIEDLRSDFADRLEERGPDQVVHMCGSGVTACHNLFAMELAGLNGSRLYAGSWSEWIRDPSRSVAKD
ncbi:MAG: sulfurtransferase [Xanthomonadales bacterium]|jgi:thiosulfate/3-mercaptopyruvate sulfurtransferase|nr:sulfurtransferase [Xanthomonadales bacterium]